MRLQLKRNYFVIPSITLFIFITGSLITIKNLYWYHTLILPAITPAPWIFRVVWPILYTLTTAVIMFVWNKTKHDTDFKKIMTLFAINAFLNWSWSFVFFGLHNIKLACVIVLLLAATLYYLIWLIAQRSVSVSALLLPYAAWTTFASYLNYSILQLNS
ncbi:tryptophan-rich sensory protein [bacterium]|nr:tryptophan-rich sensory protein [bacterium]